MVIDLASGTSHAVTLTPGFDGGPWTEYFKIWIDFNGDADFEDAGEELFSGSGSSAVSGSISIPAGAAGTTRMRVSMKYGAAPTPCETFTYGEVEDYTVSFAGGGNLPPQADFGHSADGLEVMFTDFSSDPDGAVVAWFWDFGDGNTSTEQNPAHVYATGDTYLVTLTVTDDEGDSDSTSAQVTVGIPPVADFGFSADLLEVSFTDLSSDPDGSLVAWSWSFGDGNVSSQQNPVHAYAAAGSYTVTLTVTDNQGLSASATAEVEVDDLVIVDLQNGTPVTGLSAATGEWLYFRLEVPTPPGRLYIATRGSNGNADMYVKIGELPTMTEYDHAAATPTSNERLFLTFPAAGEYLIGIHASAGFADLMLMAFFM
jgi:microbial collagenase